MADIKPGQIWRENDKRFERYIRVLAVQDFKADGASVQAETVEKKDGAWRAMRGGHRTYINVLRFNQKAGGFSLIEDTKVTS